MILIRTQNKEGIVNINCIDTIATYVIKQRNEIKEHYETLIEYFSGSEATKGVLGKYSSEEKAIKVLDMICDFCFRCEGIFQMPQDSEV